MLSMTGFGKGEFVFSDGRRYQIEISSVNRKQFELRVALPPGMGELETAARNCLAKWISRGAVQLRLTVSTIGSQTAVVNINQLEALIETVSAVRKRWGLSPEVAVENLLTLPGVFNGDTVAVGKEETSGFLSALEMAAGNHREMRQQEGAALKEDLTRRLKLLEQNLEELQSLTRNAPELIRQRLVSRFESEKLPVASDDPALLREILLYIDKGDVSEEITRLKSHFSQFYRFLEAGEPIGRQLDFLAQEIFREITTLGNKAQLPGVSPVVVNFKSEMEKIREQIQNVE